MIDASPHQMIFYAVHLQSLQIFLLSQHIQGDV